MTLTKYNHMVNDITNPFKLIDDLFFPFETSRRPSRWFGNEHQLARHPIQVETYDDGTFAVKVDVPGLSKEDLNVEINDETGIMTVSSKTEEKDDVTYSSRSLFYEVVLPEEYDPDAISAETKNGMLTVRGKLAEKPKLKKRKIKIK